MLMKILVAIFLVFASNTFAQKFPIPDGMPVAKYCALQATLISQESIFVNGLNVPVALRIMQAHERAMEGEYDAEAAIRYILLARELRNENPEYNISSIGDLILTDCFNDPYKYHSPMKFINR